MNRFPRVLGVRSGYDPDQVDLLVRRIEGTLGRGSLDGEPITADEIRDARFRTKLGGYNEMAVDFALEAFIVAIETRLAGGAGPAPRPRPRPEEPPYAPAGGRAQAGDPPSVGGDVRAGDSPSVDGRVQVGDPRSAGGDVRPEESPDSAGEVSAGRAGASVTSEEHAARIERAAFRAGRLGMGYNEDQVDAFLDRVVATLRGTTDQPVTPGDVRAARFATVMLKPGYAVNEVDEFLTDLAGVLEAHLDR
ncbi:DivIVA domain-containing protein [Streptosporangium sp. CA-135522]|uniref:DivIVA domain-containing protein n=1 Tax=Streptosporangium sp. CA-135522 TaxID=3240072 RepID=UPI003D8B8A6D